jgi:hypothetical protein
MHSFSESATSFFQGERRKENGESRKTQKWRFLALRKMTSVLNFRETMPETCHCPSDTISSSLSSFPFPLSPDL